MVSVSREKAAGLFDLVAVILKMTPNPIYGRKRKIQNNNSGCLLPVQPLKARNVRAQRRLCVCGRHSPRPPSPSPPLHFHFLLPLKSKLWLTCYLRRCFSLLPKRSPQSQVPGRAKSHLPTMQISCFELPQTIRRPRRLPVGTKTNQRWSVFILLASFFPQSIDFIAQMDRVGGTIGR